MAQVLIKIAVTVVFSFLGFYAYLVFSRRRVVERAVREETGERHAAKKRIPDMAGIVMLACYAILVPIFAARFWDTQWSVVLYYIPIAFGLLGLADDILKNVLHNTRGIPARYRIILQLILALIATILLRELTLQTNPVTGILTVIFILATINAANFTDGIDGLLAGTAIIPLLGCFYVYLSGALSQGVGLWDFLDWGHILVFIVVVAVFLFFNSHPAKMFMGDGGSMFIGAFLAIFATTSHQKVLLIIMAFVIYFELLSVVLQVISFKLFKKRIFPMTPIHHSFERWGWKEPEIVFLFYTASVVFTVLGIYIAQHSTFI